MENIKDFEISQDLRQSEEYGKYMEKINWEVIQILNSKHQILNNSKIQIFFRKIGLFGIAKIQRTQGELPMGEVEKILERKRIFMIKIEPMESAKYEVLSAKGYKISGWPLLGTKTLRVNLRPPETEIFNSFKKDCRYTLRQVLSTKYEVIMNNYGQFYEIWRKSAKRKKLWIPGVKEYQSLVNVFGKKCFCLTMGNLAGAVILIHKKTAFYYYAGSTTEGVSQNLPYLIVWEAMKEAKTRGCAVWDFEGIYDGRWPNKGWLGFSHFKKSFGGSEIEFPGSFEKWRLPI